jgi:pimeloyl-ACP methyl ester carboxylesterase
MPGHGRDWRSLSEITMADFASTITGILDVQSDPLVLVVHSRNGIVAAQAAEDRPDKIRMLVFSLAATGAGPRYTGNRPRERRILLKNITVVPAIRSPWMPAPIVAQGSERPVPSRSCS